MSLSRAIGSVIVPHDPGAAPGANLGTYVGSAELNVVARNDEYIMSPYVSNYFFIYAMYRCSLQVFAQILLRV